MTKIASSHDGGGDGPLNFILLDAPDYATDEGPLTLRVSKHHYSPQRQMIEEVHFASVEEARLYCQQRYGLLQSASWEDEPIFEQNFTFKYRVTHAGVPQPYLFDSPDAVVAFSVVKEHDLTDEGNSTPVISICGNKEGLRRLAAMLLLCAECESIDPELHFHLDAGPGVVTDLSVTIRSPAYLQWWDQKSEMGGAWRE